MQLIKLTRNESGTGIFVNMDHVREFYVKDDYTVICYDDSYVANVKETPKEIFSLLNLMI